MNPTVLLPADFQTRMQSMLGPEYPSFLASYEKPRRNGLRINSQKISPEDFQKISPFPLEPIPWTQNGFFYPPDAHPAQHPFYRCGLYYLQEPSAMTPASLLPVQPGDRVLDLCAAPGGKATELGARLKGQGLLAANDASGTRAKALLRNLELFGISNGFVTNESPDRLAAAFPEFFDKILVDAPCSGEGMFRKEAAAGKTWSLEKSDSCAKLQREILTQAVHMLSPGGLLMYSTCTFAPIENEGAVSYVLEQFPEMDLLELPQEYGFSPGNPLWGNKDSRLTRCLRLWPHRCQGEGHFLALFQKEKSLEKCPLPPKPSRPKKGGKISRPQMLLLEKFLESLLPCLPAFSWERVEIRSEKVYLLPEGLPPLPKLKGLHFLRNGLFLGELKKNRFEPSQPLALSLTGQPPARLDIPSSDARIAQYLQGQAVPAAPGESATDSGWALLCVDGFPLGWGKLAGGLFKNKYPAGWRCR